MTVHFLVVWLNLTMLLCILWSSNSCEPNTQIGRNHVFLNSLFCTRIPIIFLCISYPCIVESSNSNKPLLNYFCYRYVSKKTLCGLSCSCGAVFHPSSAAPTTEGFTTAGIRSPDCLSPPQIFFPAAGSHDNCITIINLADDLEDYMGPQERSHSSVSAYVMRRLIWWHATLSSCSPITLRLRSKLMLKLEFLNGCGVYIGAAISTICLLSS